MSLSLGQICKLLILISGAFPHIIMNSNLYVIPLPQFLATCLSKSCKSVYIFCGYRVVFNSRIKRTGGGVALFVLTALEYTSWNDLIEILSEPGKRVAMVTTRKIHGLRKNVSMWNWLATERPISWILRFSAWISFNYCPVRCHCIRTMQLNGIPLYYAV